MDRDLPAHFYSCTVLHQMNTTGFGLFFKFPVIEFWVVITLLLKTVQCCNENFETFDSLKKIKVSCIKCNNKLIGEFQHHGNHSLLVISNNPIPHIGFLLNIALFA